jgi:diguanylate cyclase (GGDEF)-like protein
MKFNSDRNGTHDSIINHIWVPSFKKYARVSQAENDKAYDSLCYNDFLSSMLMSLFVCPIMLFYLIYALCISYFNPWTATGIYKLSAIVVMLTSSLIMITWFFLSKKRRVTKIDEAGSFAFHLSIVVGVFLFFLSDIYGAKNGVTGFSASFIWFIALGIYPLTNMALFLTISGLSLIASFGTIIPFWSHLEFPFQYFIVVIGVLFVAFYFRCFRYRNAINEIRSNEKARVLEEKSLLDELTKVGNRRAMNNFVSLMVERGKIKESTLTLIIFDVDNLKSYNDNLSHLAGDDCLVKSVRACERAFPSDFTNIYRFGGDEFIILLSNVNDERVSTTIKNMIDSIAKEKIPAPKALNKQYLTISIGASTYHLDDKYSFEEQLKSSDKELYLAKQHGKGCGYYNDKIIEDNN